jgi:hypothetical protein
VIYMTELSDSPRSVPHNIWKSINYEALNFCRIYCVSSWFCPVFWRQDMKIVQYLVLYAFTSRKPPY